MNYDKTDLFTAEVLPIMEALLKVCRDNGLPVVASVCFGIKDDGYMCQSMASAPTIAGTPLELLAASEFLDGWEQGLEFVAHVQSEKEGTPPPPTSTTPVVH